MPGRRPLGRRSGFTLLEMLVALVVLGFLVIGLTQGVRASLALWQAQRHRLMETADLDAMARMLRVLLTRMLPLPTGESASSSNRVAVTKGSADRFAFVGDLPTGFGTTRRVDITLGLSHQSLVLFWTPHRHEHRTGPPQTLTETELVQGVERFELAYWGALAPGQPAAWQAQWDNPEPPDLIRLRLFFAKGDRRRWPDLIAAPRLRHQQ
jgi:general secretion pathway protein J